jgi:hypothetical protein
MVSSRDKSKLDIFENFQSDLNLPKFDKNKATSVELTGSLQTSTQGITIFSGSGSWGTTPTAQNNAIISWDGIGQSEGNSDYFQIKEKKDGFLSRWFSKKKKEKEDKKKAMTILNFFSSLAQSLNEIPSYQDIALHYETAISNAAKAGQTALVEQFKSRLESAKSEIQLVNAGLNKYLVEGQIVDFYNKANKEQKLKLTWIKNFIKPIPSKILDAKTKLDEQFIFDNYVILHYDPNNDATTLTKQEEEIKKDPILFGLIRGSRRLYYVGDWVDDYCNLTLDVVVETLGEYVNTVNNEKVKTYIDRGVREDEREKIGELGLDQLPASATTVQMPSIIQEIIDEAYDKPGIKKITKKINGVLKRKPKKKK